MKHAIKLDTVLDDMFREGENSKEKQNASEPNFILYIYFFLNEVISIIDDPPHMATSLIVHDVVHPGTDPAFGIYLNPRTYV